MSSLSSRQQGLSMIELLVALALSSILILGITQIYLDNKRTYLFQQSQILNLDSARFADLIFSDLLGKAGYVRSHESTLSGFPAATGLSAHCEPFVAGHAVTKLKSNAQGFCLRYQPAVDEESTCTSSLLGLADETAFKPAPDTEIAYVAIKFKPNDTELEQGVISCIDSSGEADLIHGVADLHIEFGVGKQDPDKTLRDSNPFVAPSAWFAVQGPVRAIRYSVLLASAPNQRDGDSAIFTHWIDNLAGTRATTLNTQDKRRIYQIATGSQALRNLSL